MFFCKKRIKKKIWNKSKVAPALWLCDEQSVADKINPWRNAAQDHEQNTVALGKMNSSGFINHWINYAFDQLFITLLIKNAHSGTIKQCVDS